MSDGQLSNGPFDSDSTDARDTEVERLFADCVNRLVAGETVDLEAIERDHPAIGRDVVRQLRTFQDMVPHDVVAAEGEVIGNYKLLQKIGEGGFGIVYMAEQLKPVKRRVAFKIIKPGMDTRQVVARFEAERQALAMMDHPNIAKVHDAGSTLAGRPFFVMELVRGVPITKFCDEQNLSTRERLTLFSDVCHAVQHAHQKGIIHRDLKPSNVMVTMHDDKAVPKVIDFGVAKATQQSLTEKTLYTRYEQFIGTPAYMSPEQAQMSGLDIDTRSDIYSLGVLLYELLTGQTPFNARELLKVGIDEIRRVIREEEPPKPSTRLSSLGDAELTGLAKCRRSEPRRLPFLIRGDLDWIVMKALEKDRVRRYDTAAGLANDIRRHLADEPVSAAAPNLSYRIAKYVRRHRVSVVTATAMAMLLLTGLSVSMWFWNRAEISARSAIKAKRVATESARAAKAAEEIAKSNEFAAKAAEQQANANALKAQAFSEQLQHALVVSHNNSAIQRSDNGKPDEALAYLAAAMRTDPNHWPSVFHAVQVLSDHAFLHQRPMTLRQEDRIQSVTVSPREDLIVTEDANSKGFVWNATTGEKTVLANGERVHGAQFSPDGELVFVALVDQGGSIVGCDSMTGRPTTPVLVVDQTVDHWFRVSSNDQGDPCLLLEHGGDGSMQVARWVGDRWTKTPRLRAGARLLSEGWGAARAATDPTQVAPLRRFFLEQRGTSHAEPDAVERPIFGFSPDGTMVYGQFSGGVTGVWNATTGGRVVEPIDHQRVTEMVRISPDSATLAIVTRVGKSGEIFWRGLDHSISHVVRKPLDFEPVKFGFDEDGKHVVVSGWSQRAQERFFHTEVFDLASGERDSPPIEAPGFANRWSLPVPFATGRKDCWGQDNFVVSPWLVAAVLNQQLKVWDLDSGKLLSQINLGTNAVAACTLLRDGRRLLTQHEDYSVRLWDVFSGTPLTEPMRHGWHPYIAPLGNDLTRLITYDRSLGKVQFWNALSGQPLAPPLRYYHFGNWNDHFLLPNSQRFVHLSQPQTAASVLAIWPHHLGTTSMQPTFLATEAPVNHAVFSPDGRRLLGCITAGPTDVDGSDFRTPVTGYVRVWDTRTWNVLADIKHPDGVVYAEFSPTENKIVSVCLDGGVRLWDLETNELTHEFWQEDILRSADHVRVAKERWGTLLAAYMNERQGQARAHFSVDGRTVVMYSVTGTVATWDVSSGRLHMSTMVGTPVHGLTNVDFLADGTKLTLGSSHEVFVIDARTGKVELTLNLDEKSDDARVSPDGQSILTAEWPGKARLWNAETGDFVDFLNTPGKAASHGVTHFVFHPTQPLVASSLYWGSGASAGAVCIWNYHTRERVNTMFTHGPFEDHLLDFSPDGKLLGGATKNGELVVWEVESGMRILHRPPNGNQINTFSADFNCDSTSLAVSSLDGITVHHLPALGALAAPSWLPDLTESIAGHRLNSAGHVEELNHPHPLSDVMKETLQDQDANSLTRWARWYVNDAAAKTISPYSQLTVTESALHRSRHGNLDDQLDALRRAPNNGILHARAGYLWAVDPRRADLPPHAVQRWDATVKYYLDRAMRLAPDSDEVWCLRAATLESIGDDDGADDALAHAEPHSPVTWYVQALRDEANGNREAAYTAFLKALRHMPPGSIGDAFTDEPLLPVLLNELRSLGGPRSPRAVAHLARAKKAEGRVAEARWLTRRARELIRDRDDLVARQLLLDPAFDPREDSFEAAKDCFQRLMEGPWTIGLTSAESLAGCFHEAGRPDQALEMLEQLATLGWKHAPKHERVRDVIRQTADHAVRRGNWRSAIIQLEKLAMKGLETHNDTEDCARLAAVCLTAKRWDLHAELCESMIERWQASERDTTLDRVAKACLSAPRAANFPKRLTVAAAQMATQVSDHPSDTGFPQYFELCRGMAEYRMGRLQPNEKLAREHFMEARNRLSKSKLRFAYPYQAMVAHQLGDMTGAQSYLQQAKEKFENVASGQRVHHDVLLARVALQEAIELLGTSE